MQFCSPIPGGLGSVCDNFLISNPLTLTEDEWVALQSQWIASGNAIECTTSTSLGNVKREIEQLCSKVKCDYATKQSIISGLNKLSNLGVNI